MEIIYVDIKTKEFVDNLGAAERSKISSLRELLEQFGYELRMPYSKKVADDIYELRCNGRIKVRIFYAFRYNHALILHAFMKKTQKTPRQEIETALRKLQLFDNI